MMAPSSATRIKTSGSPRSQSCFDTAVRAFEDAAASEDAGTGDIGNSIRILREAELLNDDGTRDPALSSNRLMRVSAANLSVARLWEGHMNALYLVNTHSDGKTRLRVERDIAAGAILGVWGADDDIPVQLEPGCPTLRGRKRFASGLGVVTHAVITVNSGPDVQLCLVDVSNGDRADDSAWNMSGMRATASGVYDFNRVHLSDVDLLGNPGDYLTEPHFMGGVWRIAALQLGGSVGLLETAARRLRERQRITAEAQMSRLSTVMVRALGAASLVQKAARIAAGDLLKADEAVALSMAARLWTEEVGLDAIRATEQSLGLEHFSDGSVTGRKARDLAVYMRQAGRDAMLLRVGHAAFQRDGALWDLLS